MASFCFYRHTPQLSLILPSAFPPPQSPRLQLYGTVVNGWRAYRPSSLGQPCSICLSREGMDWTGAEQTEEGWISCVLHLSTQVFKRLPITALCIRLCVCMCVCVSVYVCCVCTVYKSGWDKRMRSEAKRNGGGRGLQQVFLLALAGVIPIQEGLLHLAVFVQPTRLVGKIGA